MKHGGLAEIIASRQFPGITGTRDTFGIGKEFTDERTGQTIDTWKKWDKAGFRPMNKDTVKNPKMYELAKEKAKEVSRSGADKKRIELQNLPA